MSPSFNVFNFFLILVLSTCSSAQPRRNGSSVVLNLPQGRLVGFHLDNGDDRTAALFGQADVFLGIPFAQKPVSYLRFQKPRALDRFPGQSPYDATFFRSACAQSTTGPMASPEPSISEDCLYLNVFTPSASGDSRLPVMVWIHGGSFAIGSARLYGYEGAVRNLVSRGVVVVTIQYRLGLLGFFTNHSPDFPANVGLLDQVQALRWVVDNVAYFGGDPHDVTLFGQSAGGCSVAAHTYSPLSQNLFQKAIMQSGVAETCLEGYLNFSNSSFLRANQLCRTSYSEFVSGTSPAMKNCLMNQDFKVFLSEDDVSNFTWRITVDDEFLPDVPRNLAQRRPHKPVLLGTVVNEWALFDLSALGGDQLKFGDINRQFVSNHIESATLYGDRTPEAGAIIMNAYTPPGTPEDDHLAWLKIDDQVMTGMTFTAPTSEEVDRWLGSGSRDVYMYEFDHTLAFPLYNFSIPWNPVVHSSEIPFLWMQAELWKPLMQYNLTTPADLAVADWMGTSWTNFAKTGQPQPNWQPVSNSAQKNNMHVSSIGPEMASSYRPLDQIVYNQQIATLVGPLPPP